MKSVSAEYAGVALPEVRIMTNRYLSADATEKVLNSLDRVNHIRQVNMCGEHLPAVINSGPAKGLPNNHTERKIIHVNGKEVQLTCLVGAFYLEIAVEDRSKLDSVVEEIKAVCDETITEGYDLDVGRYSKYLPSLHDYKGVN